MFKTIGDIFNSGKATFNDPLYEIHNPVQKCDSYPEYDEYQDFLNNLTSEAYPKPINKYIHHNINPMHGALRPINIKL